MSRKPHLVVVVNSRQKLVSKYMLLHSQSDDVVLHIQTAFRNGNNVVVLTLCLGVKSFIYSAFPNKRIIYLLIIHSKNKTNPVTALSWI